jgi:hypothetical protein
MRSGLETADFTRLFADWPVDVNGDGGDAPVSHPRR